MIYPSLAQRINLSLTDSESDTDLDTKIDADSDSDSDTLSDSSNSKMDSYSEATSQQAEVSPSKQESHDESKGISCKPMNPVDLFRVARELKVIRFEIRNNLDYRPTSR